MDIHKIKQTVDGIPHMSFSQASEITSLLLKNRFRNILELGFRHGVSTCYMAGALDEQSEGHITTVDLTSAQNASPNIDDLLSKLDLKQYVTVYYEPTSYIWRLMRLLEESLEPRFDFCYIDGAHDWYTDGFAFYLVNQLLVPGGLIVFDDINWTYSLSPSLKNIERVKRMPVEEKTTQQVRKVFELLVKPNSEYYKFEEKGDWAYAWKRP